MLLMGDEVRRTQGGNNNAYCHDDERNWFDWSLVDRHSDVLRFVSLLNALRRRRDVVVEDSDVTLNELLRRARLTWHGVTVGLPDWSDHSHSLAFTLQTRGGHAEIHALLNAYWGPLTFQIPPADPARPWRRWIDTALPSPDDISASWLDAPVVTGPAYDVQSRSVVLLARAGQM